MVIKAWANFSKRNNSTKQPSTAGTELNVRLKNDTSIQNPTFLLTGTFGTNYTYVQMAQFFYFVEDIIQVSATQMELVCSLDRMGTWKSYISSYSCMVDRAASSYDPLISDYLITQNHETTITVANTNFENFSASGSFLIRTVGVGGIKTYAVQESVISDLMQKLFGTATDSPLNLLVQNFPTAISNAMFNPAEHILSLKWVPIAYSKFVAIGSSVNSISIGWANYSYGVYDVTGMIITTDVAPFATPTVQYNDFRAYDNNWTQYNLYMPGVGCIPIDANIMKSTLSFNYAFDIDTGILTHYLIESDLSGDKIIGTYECSGGVDIPVSQVTANNILTTAGNVAMSAITKNPTGMVNGAMGVLNGVNDTPSIVGSQSSRSDWLLWTSYRLTARTFTSKDIPTATNGRPLNKVVTLGSLTGYVQCSNASIELPSDKSDRDLVNTFLNTGFYME